MYAVWNIETKIPTASSSLTIVQGLRRPPSCERKTWAVVRNSKDSTLIILNSQTTRALLSHGISIFVKIPLLYYLDSNHQPVIFNILIALQSLVPRLFIVFSEHNKWIINLTLQILFKKQIAVDIWICPAAIIDCILNESNQKNCDWVESNS